MNASGSPAVSAVTWLASHYPWPGDEIPGIFHRTQARALEALGVHVAVVAPTPWAPPLLPPLLSRVSAEWRRNAAAPRRQHDGPIDVRRPRYVSLPGERLWRHWGRLVGGAALRERDLWQAAPLFHVHFAVPNGFAALEIARRTGLPYVLTVHGFDLNTWPDRRPEGLPRLRRALREAACVIAVSDALAERAREIAGVEAVSLPLGVDVAAFQRWRLPRDEARRRLGLPQDRFVVLFLARLWPHKGVREFVDALLDGPDLGLGVVVGDGPLFGYRAAEGEATRRIEYRGGQPSETVAAFQSAADVQILPSFSEGLPTALVEAGATGVPVIGSRAGGIPQLLGEDRGLLLPEVSPATIREALLAAHEPVAAAERARRLQAHVEAHFDVARNAERLVEIYGAAVGGPAVGGAVVDGAAVDGAAMDGRAGGAPEPSESGR